MRLPAQTYQASVLTGATLIFLTNLMLCSDCSGNESAAFSESEKSYLKQNPVLKIGYVETDFGIGKSSENYNYGNSLLSKLAKKLNVSLDFKKYSSMSSLDSALCEGEVVVAVDAPDVDRRSHCAVLSEPYFKVSALMIASRANTPYPAVDKLRNMKVVVVEGDNTKEWLKILHPNTTLVSAKNLDSAIQLINTKGADIIVDDGADVYPILDRLRTLPLTFLPIPNLETNLHFAVQQKDALLVSLLSKASRGLPVSEVSALKSNWMISDEQTPAALFSNEEKSYLNGLPRLKIAYDPDWSPIAFVNNEGNIEGLSADYWREITSTLNLKADIVPTSSWSDTLFKMASEQVDIIMPVTHAIDSQDRLLYTQPFIRLSNVIVTSGARVSRLSELNGKSVVISDPLFLRDQLKELVPYSNVEIVDSSYAGMKKVASGEAFAFIGNLSVINSLMNKQFSGDLQIVAPIDIPAELSIGVSQDYSKLLPLINRALRAIPEQKRKEINDKWLHLTPQNGISWATLERLLGFSAFLVLLITVLLLFFYSRLRKEIRYRCAAEQIIFDQLQLREALIETCPYPVVVKDVQKRYLLVNQAYEHAFSVKKSDVIGKTTLEAHHYPGDWSVTIDELATQVMRKREMFHSEFIMNHKNGDTRIWLYWMKPFYRADEELAGVMVSLVDITHIRQISEQTKSLEARLNRITTNLSVGVFEATYKFGELPKFTYLAGSIEELLGLNISDVLDNSSLLFDTVHSEDLPVLLADLERKAASMQPLRNFFRCSINGQEMHVRIDAVPENTSSEIITWNGVWVDVTESREKSIKLSKAKEAAEEAANAKSQFLATMSHEIRTPMNGILGLLELLYSKSMSHDQQQIMRMIDDSAKSLMNVLNDVLDLSKIEFNQFKLYYQKTDLRTLLGSIMGIMAHQAHAKGLRVRVSISPTLAHTINIDEMRLRQVLLNLLSNSIKFTDVGAISLKVTVTHSAPDYQTIVISVSDTGPGMSQSQQNKIFKPFTQGDTSITRRYGGTGLGLVISQHLVKLMGGELSLHSAVGIGTSVSIVMQVNTPDRGTDEKPLSGRLICVDLLDDEDRKDLTYLLSTLGATVVPATEAQMSGPLDIYFFDDFKNLELQHHHRYASVTATPIISGWRDSGLGYPTLTSNPFIWGTVVYVCNELLGVTMKSMTPGSFSEFRGRPIILVAEDHPTNQALIKSQLDRLGFDCDIAANGSEALHQFKESRYSMLITDCYMPVMDGYSLAQKIRAKLKGPKHFPILAMTASILVEERQRCIDAGIDDCLLKPLGLDTLRQAMNKWLSSPVDSPVSQQYVPDDSEDWNALLALLEECPDFARLIPGFIKTSESDIRLIEELSIQQDKQQLQEQLHRLRGALRIFRLTDLASFSEKIERELEQGSSSYINGLVEFIKTLRIMLEKMSNLL